MLSQEEAHARIEATKGNYTPMMLFEDGKKRNDKINSLRSCECYTVGTKCYYCKCRAETAAANYGVSLNNNYNYNAYKNYDLRSTIEDEEYTGKAYFKEAQSYFGTSYTKASPLYGGPAQMKYSDKELSRKLYDHYNINVNEDDKEYDYFSNNEYEETDIGSLTDESIKDIYASVIEVDGILYIDICEVSSYETLSDAWTKITDDTLEKIIRLVGKYDKYIEEMNENTCEDDIEDTFEPLEIFVTECHIKNDKIRLELYCKICDLIEQ